MIRTEAEYTSAIARLEKERLFLNAQRESLEGAGLEPAEVERAMQAAVSFHEELREAVDAYEQSAIAARSRQAPGRQ